MRQEADGKQLAKELRTNIRTAVQPGVVDVQSAVSSLSGVPSEALVSVASKVKVAVGLAKSGPKVSVFVPRNAAKGFSNAAKAFNDPGGWRAPNWGNRGWHPQRASTTNWFDPPLLARSDEMERGVLAAVDAMAARIARR